MSFITASLNICVKSHLKKSVIYHRIVSPEEQAVTHAKKSETLSSLSVTINVFQHVSTIGWRRCELFSATGLTL